MPLRSATPAAETDPPAPPLPEPSMLPASPAPHTEQSTSLVPTEIAAALPAASHPSAPSSSAAEPPAPPVPPPPQQPDNIGDWRPIKKRKGGHEYTTEFGP